jgi:hypothetical protein
MNIFPGILLTCTGGELKMNALITAAGFRITLDRTSRDPTMTD